MPEDIKTTGIDHKAKRALIDKCIQKIKEHDVVKDAFQEYGVDIDEIDNIPICFADIGVSGRTDHGCIYLNKNLEESEVPHYLVHEITHWLQQTSGDKPTQGANDGDYLSNPFELEGFQKQVEYIADTRSEDKAEAYVDQVLDHHDVDEGREEKKEELMEAVANNRFSSFLKEAGKVDDLKEKYPFFNKAINFFAGKVPTKYLEYCIKIYHDSEMNIDRHDIIKVIELFDKYGKNLEQPDIYQYGYEDFENLQKALWDQAYKQQYRRKKIQQRYKLENKPNYDVVYNSENFAVYQIKNHEGACSQGLGTNWCITNKNTKDWVTYQKSNAVFFFIVNKNSDINDPMYKIAVYTNNRRGPSSEIIFYDSQDNQILTPKEVQDYIGPEYEQIFNIIKTNTDSAPDTSYYKAKNLQDLSPEDYLELANHPEDMPIRYYNDDFLKLIKPKNVSSIPHYLIERYVELNPGVLDDPDFNKEMEKYDLMLLMDLNKRFNKEARINKFKQLLSEA